MSEIAILAIIVSLLCINQFGISMAAMECSEKLGDKIADGLRALIYLGLFVTCLGVALP